MLESQLQEAEFRNDHEKIAHIYMEIQDIDGYSAPSRAAKLLNGLGFNVEEYNNPVNSFSGGWRMRLNLARTLMCRSDLLLLDEPTNHLDLEAILWLENYLKQYTGTIILISHDREFLDAVVDCIAHIEEKQVKSYKGNYSAFETLRAEKLALQQATYEKQQKHIAHMMKFVDRFRYKASKARQAQSRLKAIARLEIISAAEADSQFNFDFKEPAKCADPLVYLENISTGYGDKLVLKNVNLSIRPGARFGLLGPNGAGKSTFIKMLAQELSPQKGMLTFGQGIKVGYYAQYQLEQLHLTESPLQHMRRIDERTGDAALRGFLGSFNFRGEMALSPIQHFSGGEKARLALALLVYQAPNLLLLDEPTNHLDLNMRNALAMALQTYQGAMLMVSHDRYLLRSTVDEFLLVAEQKITAFDGDIEDYQQWFNQYKSKATSAAVEKIEKPKQQENKPKVDQQIKQLEKKLDKLQLELKEIESKLADTEIYKPENVKLLNETVEKQKQLQKMIDELEKQWLEEQK
jgi:ATP-binding cassette subfamily F protein 3